MQCYPAASAKATSSACSRPIAERLAISAGEFGIAYSSVTLIAGFVMLHFGPSIDWIAPRRFAMLVLAGLLTGIALLTLAPWAATALLGLGLVRLCGQGLFTHLGNTLTGREFSMNRGGLGMGMQEIIATGLLVNLWGSENLGRVRAPLVPAWSSPPVSRRPCSACWWMPVSISVPSSPACSFSLSSAGSWHSAPSPSRNCRSECKHTEFAHTLRVSRRLRRSEVVMNVFRPAQAMLLGLVLLGTPLLALAQQDNAVEPDITVRQEEDRTVREYRVNGQLYAIEIKPKAGPSYFLVDDDGDGDFRRSDNERIVIPSWVLISW
ncbi:DUF2782 domain-containing protein [Modicisalibacter luteus]